MLPFLNRCVCSVFGSVAPIPPVPSSSPRRSLAQATEATRRTLRSLSSRALAATGRRWPRSVVRIHVRPPVTCRDCSRSPLPLRPPFAVLLQPKCLQLDGTERDLHGLAVTRARWSLAHLDVGIHRPATLSGKGRSSRAAGLSSHGVKAKPCSSTSRTQEATTSASYFTPACSRTSASAAAMPRAAR
jgi:hypothetical protein